MRRKKNEVSCRVCEKKIAATPKMCGGRTKHYCMDSNDGVSFHRCVWFCNDCWKLILDKVKWNGIL